MIPDYKQMLKGATRWVERYKGITIELSFHGYDPDHNVHGIWCYYLLLDEQMFSPEDWAKLLCDRKENGYYDYMNFPDVSFHGGITFYNVDTYWDRNQNKEFRMIKAGCDYNHLWDSENGYQDNFESVMFDAKYSVSKLLEQFPVHKIRCSWSGIWSYPDEVYETVKGNFARKEFIDKFRQDGYIGWYPKEGE